MWPIQLTFLRFIVGWTFLSSLTVPNASSFSTRSVPLTIKVNAWRTRYMKLFPTLSIHRICIVVNNALWNTWNGSYCPKVVKDCYNLLTFQSPLVTWCTNSLTFNNCTLCPHWICVFCIYLRTNSDLCHLQRKLIGFYNRDEKCLQRGTDWVFK